MGIKISTDASLREMIWPAVLVMSTPLLCGFLFGSAAVAGLLAGAIVSAVQMAISQSNTGGAWDNAKKFVEKGEIKVNYGKPARRRCLRTRSTRKARRRTCTARALTATRRPLSATLLVTRSRTHLALR